MAKHFSNYKKYLTSFSFMGYHFWAKDGRVATRCPRCDMVAESSNIEHLIEIIKEHEDV